MKTILILGLIISGVCVIMLWPVQTVEIFIVVSQAYIIVSVLMWGSEKLRSRRWHKQYNRFSWYNQMGLLESGYILEPKHATKYWRNLMNGILK